MASTQPSAANTNGSYLQQADPQSFSTNPSAPALVPNYQTQGGALQQPSTNPETVPKDEVGWYFVEQYYTTLNKTPERLHLFYNKRSSFVWGTEGELLQLATGRTAIQDKIQSYEFKDCKVRVSNVDSQASADNGIVIQVLGEMSNNGLPNRKFSQTFFLAEQPNGYYVLNDIFRYLKDDEDTEEGEEYEYELVEEVIAEAVVGDAVAIAVDEVTDETVEQMEDLTTKETTKAEIGVEGDGIKIEETVTVEPALPVPEPQGLPPPANGNAQPVNEVSPITETEHQPEPEPEPEPEPQVEEHIIPTPPPAPIVNTAPLLPLAEEEKATPLPLKEPERTPTPVAIPKPTPAPVPTKPKTWANLVAAGAIPLAPAAQAATPAIQTQSSPSPAITTNVVAPTSNTPTIPIAGPQWQTADSGRRSRVASVPTVAISPTEAYIKNVSESVTVQTLGEVLSKFGTLKRCEIVRLKSCAFVEFETSAAFAAAQAANPHKVGESTLTIEERRRTGTSTVPGGRGPVTGRDPRPSGQPRGRGDGRGTTGGRGTRGGYYPPRVGTTRTSTTPSGTN